MKRFTKDDLLELRRSELIEIAEEYLEHQERLELTRVEQSKPEEDRTYPVCIFCELNVLDGKSAVAAANGAAICEECVARANGALIGRPDLVIAVTAPDAREPRDARDACVFFPRCECATPSECESRKR